MKLPKKIKLNNFAFTLVELIVVITILAILWTIAFISLQWYSAQARDSKRLSDIFNIKKSLELFSLNTWKYPLPDNEITVSYSWETVWYQWTVWEGVLTNLSRNLNEKPTDPLTEWEYIYSTTHSQTEYELLWLYESDLVGITSAQLSPTGEGVAQIFSQNVNAAGQDYPKIDWNYNWIYIKTVNFYVPTPSIINANIWLDKDFFGDNTFLSSQIVTGWVNIFWVSTWWLNITLSVYEWTITEDSTDEEKSALVEAFQTAYSCSDLANDTMYADILSRISTWEMVDFVDIVVLNRTVYSSNTSNNDDNNDSENSWNDEYTKLLIHADWIWDSSSSNHVLTFNWDVQISSTWKFDDAFYFDWDWDYLTIPDSEDWDFGSGDFTIDFWVKWNSITNSCLIEQWDGDNRWWSLDYYNWGLRFQWTTDWTVDTKNGLYYTWAPGSTNWNHLAFVRNWSDMTMYINGFEVDNNILSNSIYNSNLDVRIGTYYTNPAFWYFNGYIDELRISKWIARWTEGFTPPTVPYWN